MNKKACNKPLELDNETLKTEIECVVDNMFVSRTEIGLLQSHLCDLTRNELVESAKVYRCSGYSKLKKAELANLVADAVKADLTWIGSLNSESLEILSEIVASSPCDRDAQLSGDLLYLMDRHIVFPVKLSGQEYWSVPSDLIKPLQQAVASVSDTIRDENDRIVQLASGLVGVYGVLSEADFTKLFLEALGEGRQNPRIPDVLMENAGVGATYHYEPGIGFCHYDIEDPETALKQIAQMSDLDYKMYSAEELIRVAENGSALDTPEYEICIQHIQKEWERDVLEAMELLDEVIINFQNNLDVGASVAPFTRALEFKSLEQLNALMEKAMAAYNAAPQYQLKGHAPKDLKGSVRPETVRRDTPKTGRNEPCACGSGKKNKKCCGMN